MQTHGRCQKNTRRSRPQHETEDGHGGSDRTTNEHGDDDDQHQERQPKGEVDDTIGNGFEPSAPVNGNECNGERKDHRDRCCRQPDDDRDTGPVDQMGPEIMAHIVGSEQVNTARSGKGHTEFARIRRGHDGGEYRHQHDQGEKGEA